METLLAFPTLQWDRIKIPQQSRLSHYLSFNTSSSKWAWWMSSYYRGQATTVIHGHIITHWKTKKGKKVITTTPPPPVWTHVANCCQKTTAAGVLPPHVNGKQATDKGKKKNIDPRSMQTDYTNTRKEKWPPLLGGNTEKDHRAAMHLLPAPDSTMFMFEE